MMNGLQARSALSSVRRFSVFTSISYSGGVFFFMASTIVTAMEHTAPTTTARSAPTNQDTISCGITKQTPDIRVMNPIPFRDFMPFPPASIIMMKGTASMKGAHWRLSTKDRWVFSSPTRLASVVVGMPMEPQGVGNPLASRQTRHEKMGSNPMAASMPAGMAMAVPNPAMPSMKPPKHQAMRSTSRRLSLVTDASIPLMVSMAPVFTHKL